MPGNAWDRQGFFTLNAWTADSKAAGTLLTATPVTNIDHVDLTERLNVPDEYTIGCFLSDQLVTQIAMGSYVELYGGASSPQLYVLNGYVQDVQKNPGADNLFSIGVNDPLLHLAAYDSLGFLEMGWPRYLNIYDMINGINAWGQPAVPGTRGILSGSGWLFGWADGQTTPVASTSTSVGTAPQGAQQLTVANAGSLTQYNCIRIGRYCYTLASITDSTHINIRPGVLESAGIPAGTAVQDLGYQFPGTGDTDRTDWAQTLPNLQQWASRYSFYFRARKPSLKGRGFIEGGFLNDASGLSAYGGDDLLTRQRAAHPALNLSAPNAAIAQEDGDIMVTAVAYHKKSDKVYSVFWGIGHGSPPHLVTTRATFGRVVKDSVGTPDDANGVVYLPTPLGGGQVVPGGRVYYIKTSAKTSYQGRQWVPIAAQQNDGKFAFGIADLVTIFGDAPTGQPAYGVEEYPHVDKQALNAHQLLSGLIGQADNAIPIAEWQIGIQHPLQGTSGPAAAGMPETIRPGNTIDMHFTDRVYDALAIDPTTWQYVGAGPFTTMSWPDATDPAMVRRHQRIIEVQSHWNAQGGFTRLLGFGKIKSRKTRQFLDAVARRMDQSIKQRQNKLEAVRHWIGTVPWLFSRTLDGAGGDAYMVGKDCHLQNGGFIVADIPSAEEFFGPDHYFEVDVTMGDVHQWVDVALFKPIDSTLLSWDVSSTAGDSYVYFRLANGSSGKLSGLYSTSTGADAGSTALGLVDAPVLMPGNVLSQIWGGGGGLNPCRLRFTWTQGWVHCILRMKIPGAGWKQETVASFRDYNHNVIPTGWGTIAIRMGQAAGGVAGAEAILQNIYAQPHIIPEVTRGALHIHVTAKHDWSNMYFKVVGWDGTQAHVRCKVLGGAGRLHDHKGHTVKNEDGTNATFTVSADVFNMLPGYTLVYNGSARTVTDVNGFSLAAKQFGWLSVPDSLDAHWDYVFEIGHLTSQLDPHSRLPWITGWHHGPHQSGGGGTQPKGLSLHHMNPSTAHAHVRTMTAAQWATWNSQVALAVQGPGPHNPYVAKP